MPTNDDDAAAGARLRVSRDCTPEDLAQFMPDATPEECETLLAGILAGGGEVTFTVATLEPGDDVAGLIMGPPGSSKFLRRPTGPAKTRPAEMFGYVQGSGVKPRPTQVAAAQESLDRAEKSGEYVSVEAANLAQEIIEAAVGWRGDAGPRPDGLQLLSRFEPVSVRLADGTVTADIPLSCTFTVEAEGPDVYDLTGYVGGEWVHYVLSLAPGAPITLKFGDPPPPATSIVMGELATDDDGKVDAYTLAEARLFEVFGTVDPERIRAMGGDAAYIGAAVNLAAARQAGAGE